MRYARAKIITCIFVALFNWNSSAKADSTITVAAQSRHSGPVHSVKYSPDGKMVLSASMDGTVRLWNSANGLLVRTFTGHTSGVNAATFFPDGKSIVSGGMDKTIKIWDVTTGTVIRSFELGAWIEALAVFPNGETVACATGGSTSTPAKTASNLSSPIILVNVRTGEIKTLPGPSHWAKAIAVSNDGKYIASGGFDQKLTIRDVTNPSLYKTTHISNAGSVASIVIAPTEGRIFVGSTDGPITVVNLADGAIVATLREHKTAASGLAISRSGTLLASAGENDPSTNDNTLKIWNATSLKVIDSKLGSQFGFHSVDISPDGKRVVTGSNDSSIQFWNIGSEDLRQEKLNSDIEQGAEKVLTVAPLAGSTNEIVSVRVNTNSSSGHSETWDASSGRLLRSARFAFSKDFATIACSKDGKRLVAGTDDNSFNVYDTLSGRVLRNVPNKTPLEYFVISDDGGYAAIAQTSGADIWDLETGKLIFYLPSPISPKFASVGNFALQPGTSNLIVAWTTGLITIIDARTGVLKQSFAMHPVTPSMTISPTGKLAASEAIGELKVWDTLSGTVKFTASRPKFTWISTRAAFSPDSKLFAIASSKGIEMFEVASGKVVRSWDNVVGGVGPMAFSADSTQLIVGNGTGATAVLSTGQGNTLATFYSSSDGGWLSVTPEGFFNSGGNADTLLHLVRGLDTLGVGQIHQSLYSPDLLRESLAGDPNGEVQQAAAVLSLDKVLESGPPPRVKIMPTGGNTSARDLIKLTARIEDQGKGIGRIEWRVNGVTASVSSAPVGAGTVYTSEQELALDSGKNTIEIVAYNSRNLLASTPAITTINYTQPTGQAKPKLHVLAIGINAYADKGSAGSYFPPLSLAVADAKALAAELEKAGSGLYGEVRARTVLDTDATRAGIDKIVNEMALEISPRDTFIFYVAGHGYSNGRRFYVIPQDYQGGADAEALAQKAITQERLQDWIANRIKARKAIILLDTCESGALTSGYSKSRLSGPLTEGAIGRLHEATGRPVLTAAAAGQSALELTDLGHGVFTSALIDALHHADTNRNGKIEVSELAAHVQRLVPKLAAGKNARFVLLTRGVGAKDSQSAHFGSTGGDFTLVRQLDLPEQSAKSNWGAQAIIGQSDRNASLPSQNKVASLSKQQTTSPTKVGAPRQPSEIAGIAVISTDTSTIIIGGKSVKLFGVEGRGAPFTQHLQDYVAAFAQGVKCKPVGSKYRCFIISKNYDLGEAAILNGAACATSDAPKTYFKAEQQAESDRAGIWRTQSQCLRR